MRCGCEDGGDCTKTTICQCQDAVDDALEAAESRLKLYLNEVIPIVEAACEFVDLQREAHHVPVKNERKIEVRARLYNAVMEYQESQQ